MRRPDLESGLERFRGALSRDLYDDIRSWRGDDELGGLYATLVANSSERAFLNAIAEAMVARHLRAHGCRLRFEVPTPNGRQCDFQVDHRGECIYLHVKRVDADRPAGRRLAISSHLRLLERIDRPYVVGIRWREGLDDAGMLRLVNEAGEFIRRGRVGDEFTVRDHDGRDIGGVQIMAPWEGDSVTLVIGLPTGFIDETPRIRRLLGKAYRQFMPRSTNVVPLCGAHQEDAQDFETALLGAVEERWDAHPPRGQRIAHGRASDGFWHQRRRPDSRAAVWFDFAPDASGFACRLYRREDRPPSPVVDALLGTLFEPTATPR